MKNYLLIKFGIFSLLLCLVSCSLQRQSPINKRLFVKQKVEINDKTIFDTLAQTKKESELFLPIKAINEVENTVIAQIATPTVKKEKSLIIQTKKLSKKITSLFSELNTFQKDGKLSNKFSQYGDGDEYVKDDSWKAKKYAILGMTFSIVGFLLVGLAILLAILVNPVALFFGLLVSIALLAIGLSFSIRAKKYIAKYRTIENREDKMKWIGRSAMANIGIILAAIIFGLLILTALVFILIAIV
jgi:hypothetical protein